ncbi:hypothetical protein [Persephonella sp.]|nr:hypothetical protein [Persephonella sp.]
MQKEEKNIDKFQKKIKKFRDKEKSEAYIKAIAQQIKKRKNKFKIKI